MSHSIKHATVIGAGTMGAGIAAHLANAGIFIRLLDIVPHDLTEMEKSGGMDLNNMVVRNRLAIEGLERIKASPKGGFHSQESLDRVKIGNLEDNFEWVGTSDWVIEAVIEDLEIKQDLMRRIEEVRRPDAIVTTNTSGLPIDDIVKGLSVGFANNFLGTHFFNPAPIMKLLEIIPGSRTDPKVLDFMVRFCREELGKGVVVCKDTPNFIANRIAAIQRSFDMEFVLEEGYLVEEADAILGPLVGRPKTALFRLSDLVGIDVSTKVGKNLYSLIPTDPYRDLLIGVRSADLRRRMIQANLLGRKSGAGFYKRVQTGEGVQFWGLEVDSVEHRPPVVPQLPRLEKAWEIQDLAERIRFLISEEDRIGRLVWASIRNALLYSAYCIPEISDRLLSIDQAMRWGYSWIRGPFELWDSLGVEEITQRADRDGAFVADWVGEMLDAGHASFYSYQNGDKYEYSPLTSAYQVIEQGSEEW